MLTLVAVLAHRQLYLVISLLSIAIACTLKLMLHCSLIELLCCFIWFTKVVRAWLLSHAVHFSQYFNVFHAWSQEKYRKQNYIRANKKRKVALLVSFFPFTAAKNILLINWTTTNIRKLNNLYL